MGSFFSFFTAEYWLFVELERELLVDEDIDVPVSFVTSSEDLGWMLIVLSIEPLDLCCHPCALVRSRELVLGGKRGGVVGGVVCVEVDDSPDNVVLEPPLSVPLPPIPLSGISSGITSLGTGLVALGSRLPWLVPGRDAGGLLSRALPLAEAIATVLTFKTLASFIPIFKFNPRLFSAE